MVHWIFSGGRLVCWPSAGQGIVWSIECLFGDDDDDYDEHGKHDDRGDDDNDGDDYHDKSVNCNNNNNIDLWIIFVIHP